MKPPIQVPIINDIGGIISREWLLFFTLLAQNNMVPDSMADTDAAKNLIYYSTTAGKLVYKDSGGTVHNLY